MKTRNDFVSNSSSCSFIIHNPNGCVQKLIDKLNMAKDDIVAALNMYENFELRELNTHVSQNGDMWNGDTLNFAEFIKKYASTNISDKDVVEFECDDYDEPKKNMLRLLYNVFANLGYNVDAKDSEHEFLCEDKTDLMVALRKISK